MEGHLSKHFVRLRGLKCRRGSTTGVKVSGSLREVRLTEGKWNQCGSLMKATLFQENDCQWQILT